MIGFGGGQEGYYKAMEAVGKHKRDILVERVQAAQTEQDAAKEQFASALAHFSALVGFEGGKLRVAYDKANDEFERSRSQADAVHERIAAVDLVGSALFDEWTDELTQYTRADLRRASQAQFDATRKRYEEMLNTMRQAEETMKPVLAAFKDHVLYLKHNLNAHAVASLQNNLGELETDIAHLIEKMETSIAQADSFVRQMRQPE